MTLERMLADAGRRPVFLGQSQRHELASEQIVDAAHDLVAGILLNAEVTVSGDSGLAHLAGILGRPAVVLCGPSRGEQIFCLYPSVRVLQGKLDCGGCCWQSPYSSARCDQTCADLQTISPSEVLAEVCHMGETRSASVVAAVLVLLGKYSTMDEAFAAMLAHRPIKPHALLTENFQRTFNLRRQPLAFRPEALATLIAPQDRAEYDTHWHARYKVLWETVRDLAPRRIVEIGVRAGYSSWTMLDAAPDAWLFGVDADIDPAAGNSHGGYKGAWEHAQRINQDRDFRLLIADSHKLDRLPECDLVYVDGDHTEDGCYADLLLCERSGVPRILCDDYAVPDLGVRAAVDRFVGERGLAGRFIDSGSNGLYLIDASANLGK